jgi:UDP-glucose 4-epimerase
MKILVTGGAGFIGSHITDAYIKAGHEVVIIDNLSKGSKKNINPQAKFYELDLLDPKVENVFKNENIQAINHHAAQSSVERSVSDPAHDANTNIIATLQLLQLAVAYLIENFIFASTGGAIYGDQAPVPASEEAPCNPSSPYAISKLSIEHYLKFYNKVHNLNCVTLRYSNVFGPRQDPYGESGVIAIFCNRLIENKAPLIFGDGKQTRDFVSVFDVVSANLLALDSDSSGIFNVGTGIETSILSLTEALVRLSGKNLEIQFGPPRQGEPRRSAIKYDKFKKHFSWEPNISFDAVLLETYKSFA